MHYKNGREAKLGDKVVRMFQDGSVEVGMITSLSPGNSCNCSVAQHSLLPLNPGSTNQFSQPVHILLDKDGKASSLSANISTCQNVGNYLHAEDVINAFNSLEAKIP